MTNIFANTYQSTININVDQFTVKLNYYFYYLFIFNNNLNYKRIVLNTISYLTKCIKYSQPRNSVIITISRLVPWMQGRS